MNHGCLSWSPIDEKDSPRYDGYTLNKLSICLQIVHRRPFHARLVQGVKIQFDNDIDESSDKTGKGSVVFGLLLL